MKTLIAVVPALLVASISLAAEKTTPPPAQPLAQVATQPASPADSPLVRAAKRANRLGRKPAFVITNDNMRAVAGPARMTTTDHVPNAPVVSAGVTTPPEVLAHQAADAAKAKSAADAAAAKARDEKRRERMERAAAEADGAEAIYGEDPARSEQAMQQGTQQPPADPSTPQPSQNTTRPRP